MYKRNEVRAVTFYAIKDGSDSYLKVKDNNNFQLIFNQNEATVWKTKTEAEKVFKLLPHRLKIFQLSIVEIDKEVVEYDLTKEITNLSEFLHGLTQYKQEVLDTIQHCDLAITDIEHAAEFHSYNIQGGYKIYKLLHDYGVQRRKAKNDLAKINYILGRINTSEVDIAVKAVTEMDNLIYKPRVLKELFNE